MKNNYNLYPFMDRLLSKYQSIWLISDPHFNDEESVQFRSKLECTKPISTEEQIRRINSKCGINDILIILGDVGDIEPVKKLKAGYKILVMGNHDKGKTNYQREVHINKPDKKFLMCPSCKHMYNYLFDSENKLVTCQCCGGTVGTFKEVYPDGLVSDNNLFDEVYDGKLQISKNIVLSHEPVEDRYCFNIHGHDHNCSIMRNIAEELTNIPILAEEYYGRQLKERLESEDPEQRHKFNCCCEWVGYYPINLKNLIKSGVLKEIPDMHREVIDGRKENIETNQY